MWNTFAILIACVCPKRKILKRNNFWKPCLYNYRKFIEEENIILLLKYLRSSFNIYTGTSRKAIAPPPIISN